MKCPRCGHWNQPSFPRCFKCGAPLDAAAKQPPSWQKKFEKPRQDKVRVLYDDADPQPTVEEFAQAGAQPQKKETLSEEMLRLRDRRSRGEKYLEAFRADAGRAEEDAVASTVRVWRSGDELEKTSPLPNPGARGLEDDDREAPQVGSTGAEGRYPASEPEDEFEPLDDDYDDPYDAMGDDILPPTGPAFGRSRRHKRRMRRPFAVAVWLMRILIVLAVAFCGWEGWTLLHAYLETNAVSGESVNALVEKCEVDGLPGHRITILADEGTQCYIGELTKSYVAVNGVITINVADHVFYDDIENLEVDSMTVELTPTLIYLGKEQRKAPISYEIDIPASTLTLISPETTWLEVTTSIYNIRLQVDPGSEVIVNNTDITDTVDADGVVDYNPSVQAIGDNIISITARAPYCRESRLVLTLYRQPMSIPIELSADTLSKTSDEKMTLHATTRAGATITMDTPYFSIDDSELATTGQFSVEAKMTRIGYNDIIIHASYPGVEDSTLTHSVYYLPPANIYTPKAWALGSSDYAELMNNINLRVQSAQIYLCRGEIVQIISEKPQIAIMNTGSNGAEQPVMLQNETATTWTLGESYRVYADVTGVYGSMPKFMARYTYGL